MKKLTIIALLTIFSITISQAQLGTMLERAIAEKEERLMPTQAEQEIQPLSEQPQINPRGLFPPRRPTEGGYVGTSESSSGISFSLAGRQANNLATPVYDSPDQGTVVVRIWVNQQGVVLRAEAGQRGTTVTDRVLWREAENATMRSRFTPDANAPDQQVGTITYRFIRLN